LRAFAEAGADVLYAPGLRTVEHVKAVCDAVAPKPVNVLAGPAGGGLPVASLEAAGARRISVGSGLAAAALGAFLRAAREIKDKGSFTYGKEAASHAEISKFMAGK
jgi:2-methylisocitrate lyase-like PEP mutase family enzyme